MSEHAHTNYVKIWGILLILLVISIVGPFFGILAVTLITAFGIAAIKALMVAGYFMHLNVEKRYIWYVLICSAIFLGLFFFGVAPDIMKKEGQNWKNISPLPPAALEYSKKSGSH